MHTPSYNAGYKDVPPVDTLGLRRVAYLSTLGME